MGFEELAALKEQLTQRARAEKAGRDDGRTPRREQERSGQPAANARPAAQARPPRPQKSTGDAGDARTANGSKGAGRRPGAAPVSARAPGGTRPAHRPRPAQDGAASATAATNVAGADNGNTANNARRSGPHKGREAGAERRPPSPPVDPVVMTIGQLQRRFPNAFPKNPAPKRALKLGISKDLATHLESMSMTEATMLEAIKVWCQGSRYWAALTKDAPRVNLEGEPEGTVTPEQAARARSLSAMQRRTRRASQKPVTTEAGAEAGATVAADKVADGADTTSAESKTVAGTPDQAASDASSAPAAAVENDVPDVTSPSTVDEVAAGTQVAAATPENEVAAHAAPQSQSATA